MKLHDINSYTSTLQFGGGLVQGSARIILASSHDDTYVVYVTRAGHVILEGEHSVPGEYKELLRSQYIKTRGITKLIARQPCLLIAAGGAPPEESNDIEVGRILFVRSAPNPEGKKFSLRGCSLVDVRELDALNDRSVILVPQVVSELPLTSDEDFVRVAGRSPRKYLVLG